MEMLKSQQPGASCARFEEQTRLGSKFPPHARMGVCRGIFVPFRSTMWLIAPWS